MQTTNQPYLPSLQASNSHYNHHNVTHHHQPAAPSSTNYPLLPSRAQSPFTDGTLSPFSQLCPPQSYHRHSTFPNSFQPLQPASRPCSPFLNRQPPRPQPLLVGRSLMPVPSRVHPVGPSATNIPQHVQYSLPPSMNRNGSLEVPMKPNGSFQQLNNFNSQEESGMYACQINVAFYYYNYSTKAKSFNAKSITIWSTPRGWISFSTISINRA